MLISFGQPSFSPLVSSIEHIDRHEWDALVSDNDFFHSHGWLGGLDYALGKGDVFTLYGNTGLLGGCALWDGEDQSGLFYLPDYFPGLEGPWQQPFLWGGARRSTHNEIPCVQGEHRGETLSTIAEMLAQLAGNRGYYATIMPFMPLQQALEVVRYYPHARVLMHSGEATISVPAGGLGSQLQQLRSHQRVRTNAELATFSRLGNRVEWCQLDDYLLEAAVKLIANNRGKYGSHQGIDWMQRIFDGQKKSSVIDAAIAAVAKRDKQILGVTIFYRFGETLHARYYGSNYQIDDNDFRYFVLTYYYSLDYAAKNGIRECRLSISALRAKTRRGAKIEPLAALLLFENTAPLSISECKDYNHLFYQHYQQQFGTHLTHDWALLN
ncbi:peptidogalycan biosysnthesis protein [Xenorhabdus sp. XENO-10]|uniref:Peptidogalycan biosysnthesis protein n=1 Tax=Xenorhabdus yunnanensis TaxID=3025878 RepID=A0ABT5LKL0_9GAMM|nr:peptidogalycan biosysnthesis protein [Xenorhabdus yunnanensis]MDC9590384.1 peptidogalycan biosysnthesis protein [Xenorhabdus yunnanensis]